MNVEINAEQLVTRLPRVIERVRRGECFTVVYDGRPAFQIVPVNADDVERTPLGADPLFQAEALGRSRDRQAEIDHDLSLYPPA